MDVQRMQRGGIHVDTVALISNHLLDRAETIAQAIQKRELYFRISLVGACNLHCPFCHNEGGPEKGKLKVPFVVRATRIAHELGFRRVQFTGGEPLLHPRVADFVAAVRQIMPDIGITTNGTYLPDKFDALLAAGLSRIHVSLQAEALRTSTESDHWAIPSWLSPVLERGRKGIIKVRLNLPVPMDDLAAAHLFLTELSLFGCDVNLFSILPRSGVHDQQYTSSSLEEIAAEENYRRLSNNISGRIIVRGYRAPSGIRCASCADKLMCKEQSHSLRLGVDRILRPCLATRKWDIQTTEENLWLEMKAATLLALDYTWAE
jgi:GTP 3',8-cyclase